MSSMHSGSYGDIISSSSDGDTISSSLPQAYRVVVEVTLLTKYILLSMDTIKDTDKDTTTIMDIIIWNNHQRLPTASSDSDSTIGISISILTN